VKSSIRVRQSPVFDIDSSTGQMSCGAESVIGGTLRSSSLRSSAVFSHPRTAGSTGPRCSRSGGSPRWSMIF